MMMNGPAGEVTEAYLQNMAEEAYGRDALLACRGAEAEGRRQGGESATSTRERIHAGSAKGSTKY